MCGIASFSMLTLVKMERIGVHIGRIFYLFTKEKLFGGDCGEALAYAAVGILTLAAGISAPHAAEWYVDSAAPASGSGRSRDTAWRHFAEIDWASFRPGDSLHILGDPCGPPFRETLVVGASGTQAAPLHILGTARVVKEGTPGGPVIDGDNRREFGVVLNGRNHVVLRGLELRNHAGAGIAVRGAQAGVLVEANNVHSGDPGGGNARGIDARGNVGKTPLLVRGNRYTTPAETAAQTDGIWSSNNDGVVFEGNSIVISNRDETGHSDGFQSYQDRNVIVRGNWFEQANMAKHNNHGAWIENTRDGGVVEFSDNVVLAPHLTADAVVAHYMRAGWEEKGSVAFQNNTLLGGNRTIYLHNSPRAQVRANIVIAAREHAIVVLENAPPAGNIDHNLMWSPAPTLAYMGKGNLSWSQWRGLGYDAHGINADPRPESSGQVGTWANARARFNGRGAALERPLLAEVGSATCSTWH